MHIRTSTSASSLSSEYDALSRIGIDDPCEYISQRYCAVSGRDDLVQLSTCCVGKAVVSRVEGALEEMLGSGDWFDSMVSVQNFIWLCVQD